MDISEIKIGDRLILTDAERAIWQDHPYKLFADGVVLVTGFGVERRAGNPHHGQRLVNSGLTCFPVSAFAGKAN